MKKKLALQLLFCFIAILLSHSINASDKYSFPTNGDEIKLNVTTAYSTKVVQISFDGNDGEKGLFQIFDSEGTIVFQMEEAELIKSPSYFTIEVADFKSKNGNYKFVITTKNKTYSTVINL